MESIAILHMSTYVEVHLIVAVGCILMIFGMVLGAGPIRPFGTPSMLQIRRHIRKRRLNNQPPIKGCIFKKPRTK